MSKPLHGTEGAFKDLPYVNTARPGLADGLRLLCGTTAALLVLCCVGCRSASKPLHNLSNPFSQNSQDESLHKQVEADRFPTATQAGCSSLQKNNGG